MAHIVLSKIQFCLKNLIKFCFYQSLAKLTDEDRKLISTAQSICRFIPLVKVKQSREGHVEHVPTSLASVVDALRTDTVKVRINSIPDVISQLSSLGQSTIAALRRCRLDHFAVLQAENVLKYITYISDAGVCFVDLMYSMHRCSVFEQKQGKLGPWIGQLISYWVEKYVEVYFF